MFEEGRKNRTEQDWDAVYSLLVKEVGAAESERSSFVYHCTHERLTEWRFSGNLGFGGKIWLRPSGRLNVTAYSEDATTARTAAINRINQLLSDK